jgi:hypothetical protein
MTSSTKGLTEIPLEEIVAELGDSALARMLLEAIDASRDATTWFEQASVDYNPLLVTYHAKHAAIVHETGDAGAAEWKAKARADATLAELRTRMEEAADERDRALEAVRSRRDELTAWAALVGLAPPRTARRAARQTPTRRQQPAGQR